MDNRFKFRAWIGYLNRMITVDGIDSDGDIRYYDEWGDCICFHDDIHDYTLMQCTGLLATSSYRGESEEDQLIYEGDIVQFRQLGNIEEVQCGFVFFDIDHYRLSKPHQYLLSFITESCEDVKIIGNIHEHPELLKGE